MLCEALDRKLEELEVRPLFYYNGCTTTCLLLKGKKVVARGISICSPKDQFIKREGRVKATGRAIGALINRTSYNRIYPSRFSNKEEYNNSDIFLAAETYRTKSAYSPKLTKFEESLIERINKKKGK